MAEVQWLISKHPHLFLHVQLFPPWHTCKLIFGDSKNAAEVWVGEMFLKTNFKLLVLVRGLKIKNSEAFLKNVIYGMLWVWDSAVLRYIPTYAAFISVCINKVENRTSFWVGSTPSGSWLASLCISSSGWKSWCIFSPWPHSCCYDVTTTLVEFTFPDMFERLHIHTGVTRTGEAASPSSFFSSS